MKEGTVTNELLKRIRFTGRFCYKVSDRHHIGIPDIYIRGGNWIEVKSERKLISSVLNFNTLIRPEQATRFNEIILGGDKVFIATYWEGACGKMLYFNFWQATRNSMVMPFSDLKKSSFEWKDRDKCIKGIFDNFRN